MARPKRCPECGDEFVAERMGQKTCRKFECAIAYGRKLKEKKEAGEEKAKRKETKSRLEKLKPRSDWMKDAQQAVNAFVRERDSDLPCISCGRHHQGQYHAGHYLSRGAHPELALDPRNIHKQCQPCNTHLSGNQIEYRKGLIARYGIEFVDWLEGPHSPAKHTIHELKEIRDNYRDKLRDLKRNA